MRVSLGGSTSVANISMMHQQKKMCVMIKYPYSRVQTQGQRRCKGQNVTSFTSVHPVISLKTKFRFLSNLEGDLHRFGGETAAAKPTTPTVSHHTNEAKGGLCVGLTKKEVSWKVGVSGVPWL